jgi:hypothetical protein
MVAATRSAARDWGGALWQLRFVVLAALVLLLGAFSVPSVRSLLAGGAPAGSTVGVGTEVSSPTWTYGVGAVRRMAQIGNAQARGTYLVVTVAATNRGATAAQLQPNTFAVAGSDGLTYSAEPPGSAVYSSGDNPSSSYAWPSSFPVARRGVAALIFDVPSSISGPQLVIPDVPAIRIRLE